RIQELAKFVRRLHDYGIYHRDLNPLNFLVSRNGEEREQLLLVDLDSIHLRRRLTDRRRRKNLVQLGLLPEGHIQVGERLRFLRHYDRNEKRYWNRDWLRALGQELAEETVRILARFTLLERQSPPGASIGDPRFQRRANDRG
ncbi:MAG: lipopolysaccharide kinase InaA family protein, partial [Planctomycetota bacterium]